MLAGGVADEGLDAQPLQAAQRGAVDRSEPEISVAQVAQDFGDAGHAGAADADEMNVLDRVLHRASSSQAATICRSPWSWRPTSRPRRRAAAGAVDALISLASLRA
jgi:hypothetical protein